MNILKKSVNAVECQQGKLISLKDCRQCNYFNSYNYETREVLCGFSNDRNLKIFNKENIIEFGRMD